MDTHPLNRIPSHLISLSGALFLGALQRIYLGGKEARKCNGKKGERRGGRVGRPLMGYILILVYMYAYICSSFCACPGSLGGKGLSGVMLGLSLRRQSLGLWVSR
jgi:hypothetical protein